MKLLLQSKTSKLLISTFNEIFYLGNNAMTKTIVQKKSFKNEQGSDIEYKVLAIIGTISGTPYTLEIKAGKTELAMAEILLNSDENITVKHGTMTEQDKEDFLEGFEE